MCSYAIFMIRDSLAQEEAEAEEQQEPNTIWSIAIEIESQRLTMIIILTEPCKCRTGYRLLASIRRRVY